ncbi:MAG: hypothetical protein R3C19_14500 [Planctomycetaceae bacterium]
MISLSKTLRIESRVFLIEIVEWEDEGRIDGRVLQKGQRYFPVDEEMFN